jgi:hypothetical protein
MKRLSTLLGVLVLALIIGAILVTTLGVDFHWVGWKR